MTSYLIRRVLQMIVVILVSAAASYALLNFAPGGPLAGLRQITQSSRFRITEEDIARIRAYFELDLIPARPLYALADRRAARADRGLWPGIVRQHAHRLLQRNPGHRSGCHGQFIDQDHWL